MAYCTCSRCGWGLFEQFFSHLSLLYSFSLSLWETVRYRLKYCLKGPFSPKQQTNRPGNPNKQEVSRVVPLFVEIEESSQQKWILISCVKLILQCCVDPSKWKKNMKVYIQSSKNRALFEQTTFASTEYGLSGAKVRISLPKYVRFIWFLLLSICKCYNAPAPFFLTTERFMCVAECLALPTLDHLVASSSLLERRDFIRTSTTLLCTEPFIITLKYCLKGVNQFIQPPSSTTGTSFREQFQRAKHPGIFEGGLRYEAFSSWKRSRVTWSVYRGWFQPTGSAAFHAPRRLAQLPSRW